MADDPSVAAVPRCPWCSSPLPSATSETCPQCGAALVEKSGDQSSLPGVTTLDTDAILRARSSVSRPRSRLLSFITGDVDEGSASNASPGSFAPPSEDVRREMLKMALAAEVADLEAEVQARVVEAEVEAREAGLIQPDAALDLPTVHSAEEAEDIIEELVPAVAGHGDEAAKPADAATDSATS
jgi:hypothetical protein